MINKKNLCLIVGLLITLLGTILPQIITYKILLIFLGSIILWITSNIEVGSISCLLALMATPEIGPNTVFTASFGNSTIVFLIFSMILTYELSQTGLLRRIALFFVDNPIAKRNKYCFLGFYLLAMLVLGSVIAPTTLFILFFGIVNEIYNYYNLQQGDRLAKVLMIGTGFFASISCAMTPIAHTFPIMALGYYETATGMTISYGTYMKYSIPIGIVIAFFTYLLLVITIPDYYKNFNLSFEKTKISKKEIISGIVFIFVILWWVIVGIWPNTFSYLNKLGTAFPAILGCLILAIVNNFSIIDGFKNGVSWSAILLCASTLAIGKAISTEDFGIINLISSIFQNRITLFSIIIFTIVLTNIISNIVTTTLAFNIFIPALLISGSCDPVIATIIIGIGASLAFALPSSIAHIALAGSSGWANSKDMMLYGAIVIVISILTIGGFVLWI